MDFQPTEDQRLIVDNARRFIDRELRGTAEAATDRPIEKAQLQALLGAVAPLGYLGSRVPAAAGGHALPMVTTMLLYEELFCVFPSLAGAAFVNDVVAFGLHRDGSAAQQEHYLGGLMGGQIIACQAATEPQAGSDVRALRMRARETADGYRLRGRKIWISNGSYADLCLVVARTGDGDDAPLSRFLVDREPGGFQSREIETIGLRGFSTAELVFDDTVVPKANLMGRAGDGLTDSLIDFGATRCYAAIGAVGVARAALEAAAAYACERVQWGKPIAGHQLIQAHIAEMATQLDCARLLTLRAADRIDRGMRCDAETSMAKYFATEAAVRITSAAIQVHGAIGLSAELPLERYFRDARMMTIPDGTSEIQKLIIARNILGVAAFGESSARRDGDPA